MPSKDTKILKFNLYKKSDKAAFTFYADLECIMKRFMGVKIIVEINKEANILHQVFQHLQYLHLEALKISMVYIEVKLHKNVL